MKILITTDLFTVTTNGVVTSVKNLWDELKSHGHDVRILTLSDNIHSHRDGDVYYIRSMPFAVYPNVRMPLSYRHHLIKELIEWAPDVIHSQCEFFSFQYALRISRKTGAPIVHTYHTLYEQYVGYVFPSRRLGCKIVRVFSRKRLKRVKNVIAPTHKVEDTLHTYGLKNSISVVPSGISLAQHFARLTPDERLEKRRALGIHDDTVLLVNIGRVGAEKNLGELVTFFSKAVAKGYNIMFMIVGDGPARKDLENQACELGIDEKMIFTGMVKPGEVQNYYQLGDVFVSASTSETQGLTYIEAAANALPLLCRKDMCLDEVLYNGENGYDYTNEDEFMRGLDAVVNDPEWRKTAGKKSEDIARAFDKSSFGVAVEQLYESIVKANKG